MRHAAHAPVIVTLSGTPSGIRLAVCDQGTGFDMNMKGNQGLGLINMRERMRTVDGTLKIHSRPGRGTSIVVSVPVPASRPQLV